MYKKILLPIDHADEATWKTALPAALEEARLHGAELSVVTVLPEILRLPNLPEDYGAGAKAHVQKKVQGILNAGGADTNMPISVREGSIYREILKEAHAIHADLIIIASAKGDFPDYPFGPNAARVARYANCSVMILRG
jgi:universal stress protein F